MKIGVLALQGAVKEHCQALAALGIESLQVKYREELDQIAGLIIPGGESTTVGKLLVRNQMMEPLRELGRQGFPIFGTCTGMILLAKDLDGIKQPGIALMEMTVVRNAFGRQIASFEAELDISEIGEEPYKAIFIRAPYVTSVGAGVQVLSELDDKILLVREGNLLAAAFHPELTADYRIHQYFVDICRQQRRLSA